MTLEQLYEARIDSTRSINYYGEFDCFCETVFFSLCDGDTGESLKTYEVSFDEETGEVDYDVEFTSEHDSGYCDFKRLPKQVREHVLAIVKAYIEEQAEENALFEESAEMEATEKVEESAEMGTPTEVNTSTLAQQFNAMFRNEVKMFEFTITYANGNILTLRESDELHAKGLKREFSDQVNIGLIKGFSIRQNGVIIFACFKN